MKEAALAEAQDDRRHAFIEFMNFLEVYSAAANGGLLGRVDFSGFQIRWNVILRLSFRRKPWVSWIASS